MYSQSGSHNQPAEVFRKDLISAMKLPDSAHLDPDEYFLMADTWKPEWEKGVQVPVNPNRVPSANVEEVRPKTPGVYKIPRKLIKLPPRGNDDEDDKDMKGFWRSLEAVCKYDLDETDRIWLAIANSEREETGYPRIDELTVERIVEECEIQCHSNIEHAIQTEEGLGIEYDEDVICDVCRAPDCEEGNEMVFCDKCDVCVHQACYGIINVPEGTWMCRTCALGIQPACLLCGKKGGVMKSTRSGTKWSHVSCALWVPEVSIGCVDRMEPVTKISQIPASRWALVCNLCRVRTGACIQCSVKTCKTAYHVTCGFENSLEMKTFLDEDSEVRFKSFCLKHCSKKTDVDSPRKQGTAKIKEKTQEEKANDRVIRIQRIMEEFYDYAESDSVAAALGMKDDIDTIDLLVQYWKLKRRANFNKPLISFRKEDETPSENEEYNLTARLKMFVHLRQDLERVRNLCYMVQKREKLSKQYLKLKHQIFKKQCDVFDGDTSDLTKEEIDLFVNADELSSKERVNERLDKLEKCSTPISDEDDASDANSTKADHKPVENQDADSISQRDEDRSLGHSDADVSDLESEEEKQCLTEKFGTNSDVDLETTKQVVNRSHITSAMNRKKRFKRTVNGQFSKNSSKKAHRDEQNSDNVFSEYAKKKITPAVELNSRNGVDVATRLKSTEALREIEAKENNENVCKGRKSSSSRKEVKVEKENDESLSETEFLRRTKCTVNDTSIDQSEQLYIDNNSDSNLSSDLRTLSLGKIRRTQNQKTRTKEWIEEMSDDSLSNFEDMKNTSASNTNNVNHCESDDSISESDRKPKRNRRRSRQMSGNKIVKNESKDNESDDSSVKSAERSKRLPRKQMQSKNNTVSKNDSLKKKSSISKTVEPKCAKSNNIKMPVRTKAMRKIIPAWVTNNINKGLNKSTDVVNKSKLLSDVGKQENVDTEIDSDECIIHPKRHPRKCTRMILEDSSSKEESLMPTYDKDKFTDAEVKSDDGDKTPTVNSRVSRNLRKHDTKPELKVDEVPEDVKDNVDLFENTARKSPEKFIDSNTNDSCSVDVEVNHVEQVQTPVLRTRKALPMKPRRRSSSVNSNANLPASETEMPRSLRRSKRTIVGPKNDFESPAELDHLPKEVTNEVDQMVPHEPQRTPVHEPQRTPVHEPQRTPVHELQRTPVHEPQRTPVHEPQRTPVHEPQRTPVHEPQRTPVHEPNRTPTESLESLQENIVQLPNSVNLSNSASDTTINELACGYVASPQQSVHLELEEESSSGESHFGIRKTITDFLAHGDSSSAESNVKMNAVPRAPKRLRRSVRNAVIKQSPPKEHRSSTESEDDARVVQKQVITPPALVRSEQIVNEGVKDEVVKDEVVKDEVVKDEIVKDEVVKDEVVKDEVVKEAGLEEEEKQPAVELSPAKEENTSSSDSEQDHSHASSGQSGRESDSGSQSSSSSSSQNSDSSQNRNSSSSSSDSSESFHSCESCSESSQSQVNSDKEEPQPKVTARKVLRRSTRVQTQQQTKNNNSSTTNASDDPYHEDHIDAELEATTSPTLRKRVPEGIKRKEPQNLNQNAFAKKPRRNGFLQNSHKIDSYFKPIPQSANDVKNERIPNLIIRIPECIQKSPTKLKIRVPSSPFNSYNSTHRDDDYSPKKRIKTNHVNDTDFDIHRLEGLNAKLSDVTSIVTSPETRGARRRIDLELNSKGTSLDREFENVDNEISICRSSREPSPGSETSQKPTLKAERIVLRRTTGGNYQVSHGSQR